MTHTMRIRHITVLLIALVILSCTRENPVQEEGRVRVNVVPGVNNAIPVTKEAIFPTETNGSGDYMMPLNSSYGMFICEHHSGSYTDGSNPYTEHAERYNNIRAVRSNTPEYGDCWLYNYSGYSSFPTLFLVSRLDGVTADFFAYAPFKEDMATPEEIPFVLNLQPDLMYAAENPHPTQNKDINPLSYVSPGPGYVDVPMTFTHALSLLEFNFSLKHTTSEHPEDTPSTTSYALQSITVSKGNPSAHLYTSGKMNALTGGTLSDLAERDELELPVEKLFGPEVRYTDIAAQVTLSVTHPVRVNLMLVPTQPGEEYADGDYVFNFVLSGQPFTTSYSLLRSHLLHDDGVTYGFKPGYRYKFNFIVDNYLHFDGVEIGEWTQVINPLIQSEI